MTGPKRIATIARAARIVMGLTTLAFFAAIVLILYQAATGDLSGVEEVVERDLSVPLRGWQIAVGALLLLVSIAPILMAFWSAHRFFQHYAREELFAGAMEGTVKALGWSLIWFWILDWLTDIAAIPLVTYYEPNGTRLEIGLPIDETVLLPIVGIILVSIAGVLAEARRIDEDSKLIV